MNLTEAENIKMKWQQYTEELYKISMTRITMVMCSLAKNQTSWNAKSSWPLEASLQTKLVEAMEFQLSYFKS